MRSHPGRRRCRIATAALAAVLATLIAGCGSGGSSGSVAPGSLAQNTSLKGVDLTVGGKEFTEQLILCQMTGMALQSAGANVTEKCGISGSNSTRTALTSNNIDMYWEYTGTAWINYLKHTTPIPDATQQYQQVAAQDLSENHVKWLDPAPANNTYTIAVKTTTADQLGVHNMSDYAKLANTDPTKATTCIASEFANRSDGWPGLQKAYGFTLPAGAVATLQEGAIYNAVGNGNPCNFGEADTTDGRLEALKLTALPDDKNFFPVYNPALTLRQQVFQAHPDIAKIINPIAAKLTTETLIHLNGQVDVQGKTPADVARTWLQDQGFIGKG